MSEDASDNSLERAGRHEPSLEQYLIGLYEKFIHTRGETRELMALLVHHPDQAAERFRLINGVREELRQYLKKIPSKHQFKYYLDGLMGQLNTDVQRCGIVHDLRFEYFGENEYHYPEDAVVQTYLVPLAEGMQEFGVLFRAVLALREEE